MTVQRRLYDPALYSSSAPVDDADLPESRTSCGGHILVYDRRDVPRGEGMQIELGLERDVDDTGHAVRIVRHARRPVRRRPCDIRP